MYKASLLIVIFFCCTWFIGNAQTNQEKEILKEHSFHDEHYFYKRNVTFGISSNKNWLLKYNPVSLVFSSLMFTYQKWISKQISADCLYHPTCSGYCKSLFHEHGFVKGMIASSDRLMRCDRISATTINPVSISPHDGKVHENPNRYNLREKE
jgi:putative membrane protein insertion efficiency factor